MSQQSESSSTNSLSFVTSSSPLLEQLVQSSHSKVISIQMTNGQSIQGSTSSAAPSSQQQQQQSQQQQQAVRTFQTGEGDGTALQNSLQVIHLDAVTLAALSQLSGSSTDVTGFQQALICQPSSILTSPAKDNSTAVEERTSSSSSSSGVVTASQTNELSRAFASSDQTIIQIPNGANLQQLLQSLVGGNGVQQVYMLQMNNAASSCTPLSLVTGGDKTAQTSTTEEEPFYVNAKQYKRIMQRRQVRGRLESEGRIPKTRKKYLHESRHLHALNRVRGEGGRFNPGAKRNASSKGKGNSEDSFSEQTDANASLCISEQQMDKVPQKILPKPIV